MEKKSAFPEDLAKMEEMFRELRKSTNDEYDKELDSLKVEWEIQQKERKEEEKEIRTFLSEMGVDLRKYLSNLEKMEKNDLKKLHSFLKRCKPQFVDREPNYDMRLREEIQRTSFFNSNNWNQANLIGADLLAPDKEFLSEIEGEQHNPGVWLYDAKKVKDKSVSTGKGCGCSAYGHMPYAHTTVWYYTYMPPHNGKYWIYAGINYHGFFVIYANDKSYNSKNAEIHVKTDIEAIQYFPRGIREHRIIDLDDDNISKSGLLDAKKIWSFNEIFGGGDLVQLRVRFAIDTDARGNGSYAEVNFQDGKANYIDAPFIFIVTE